MKSLYFEGSSRADIRALPKAKRQQIGFQLKRLQYGRDPENLKPLDGLGKGITGDRQIRVEIDTNIYRSAYVTKIGEAIAVLHCWNKITEQTTAQNKMLIADRYKSAKAPVT